MGILLCETSTKKIKNKNILGYWKRKKKGKAIEPQREIGSKFRQSE